MLRHPHAYTLELLRLAVDKLPPTFSVASRAHYDERLKAFQADPGIPYDEISATIVALGKESWPFRRAYNDLYDRYGRASEEAHLLTNLDAGIREKYERFLHEGGKINHIEAARSAEAMRAAVPFESYFTPEEKFGITQALLSAREEARQEIDELVVGKKREEYGELVAQYAAEQRQIESSLGELRALGAVSRKWQPDIVGRLRTLEEGWSIVERPLTLADARHEVDYWKGTLESFLQAA